MEPNSPFRTLRTRGKKRGAAVNREHENIVCNIYSASNKSSEKPLEKRTTLSRLATRISSPWPSTLPVAASIASSLQESSKSTQSLSKSWKMPVNAKSNSTASHQIPATSNCGASKGGPTEQTPGTLRFTSRPPFDSGPPKSWVSSTNLPLQQSTPSCSVSRLLGYSATPDSAASVGSSRASGSGRSSVSMQFNMSRQTLEQQFDVEDDPRFWENHNVQVILRIRPISTSESKVKGFSRCVRQENPHSITWIGPPEAKFTFDHVAGEHISQEKLFKVAGVPMVKNCMAGYNSCMFCYGQTGSGKTYTMLGDIEDPENQPSDGRGIIRRVFEYLFSQIKREEEARKNEHMKYCCKCSFLEIHNEQIIDLLEPTSTNLQLREGGKKGLYVENLLEIEVRSVQEVIQLLLLGSANRKVAATTLNRESSRSHSVFICTIESRWELNSMVNFRIGRLNLVDLAGSERQKNSGAEGNRLKEASNINKSLSTLGLVIMTLVDVANGKQRHVPYRDSKLTYLLQDSLGGNSKTTMIANISPSSCCALETLSTLKFAQRAKFIRNNEELDRMKRPCFPRTPSTPSVKSAYEDGIQKENNNLGLAAVTVDENDQFRYHLDSWDYTKSFSGSRFRLKKLEAMEAALAGALRREREAELMQKRQASEIEQLNRLVKLQEDDSQCSKMILRFREDKIKRLEALSAGITTAATYLRQEKDCLMNELQLMQAKIDCNPELTRFAMENNRLMEQLRRFQDFYAGGEREAMADEISNLKDQLLEVLESKLTLTALTSPQREALAPELAAAKRDIELLRIEADNYRREVVECRKNLTLSLEANSRLAEELDESDAQLREVKLEFQVHQEDIQKLRELVLDAGSFEQETREILNAAETLVTQLQHVESCLSIVKEMAALAKDTITKTHLEAKEMVEYQCLSFKHFEAAAQSLLKVSGLRELDEDHSFAKKLSPKTNLKSPTSDLLEKLSLGSELQHEDGRDEARMQEAEIQPMASVHAEDELREDIENYHLEYATALKYNEHAGIELAQMGDVLTRSQMELVGCNRKEKLAIEKKQLSVIRARDEEVFERLIKVTSAILWWFENKMAADKEFQEINHDDIAFRGRERNIKVTNLRNEIVELNLFLKDLMEAKEILNIQSPIQMQEIENAREEMESKESLLKILQKSFLILQSESSRSEDRNSHLVSAEGIQIEVDKEAENFKSLERKFLQVQRSFQNAEAKVVNFASAQADLSILQEKWEVNKEWLEPVPNEAKQRCRRIEEEVEHERNVTQRLESEFEEVHIRAFVLRDERDNVSSYLHKELKRSHSSTEFYKHQLELLLIAMSEVDMHLQKRLKVCEVEKEAISDDKLVMQGQYLIKDDELTAVQLSLGNTRSQLDDPCLRESKLRIEQNQLLESKGKIQGKYQRLRSKSELICIMEEKSHETFQQENVLELNLKRFENKVEDMLGQMQEIVVYLDPLFFGKEKLEFGIKCFERRIFMYRSSPKKTPEKDLTDRGHIEISPADRKNMLLKKSIIVQFEEFVFILRMKALKDVLDALVSSFKQKEDGILMFHRKSTEPNSAAVQLQEELHAPISLKKLPTRSFEESKYQKESLPAEANRLNSHMACEEITLILPQEQNDRMKIKLQKTIAIENITHGALSIVEEELKVVQLQWKLQKNLSKDCLKTKMKLVDCPEAKQGIHNFLKKLEKQVIEITRRECDIPQTQIHDVDSTILSLQIGLNSNCAICKEIEIELEYSAPYMSAFQTELVDSNRAQANSQDGVRCQHAQVKQFETKLDNVLELLRKSEEELRKSERDWFKRISETDSKIEAPKLCANKKDSPATILKRWLWEAHQTLKKVEPLAPSTDLESVSNIHNSLKGETWEGITTLQSSEIPCAVEKEVVVTIYHVKTHIQFFDLDIHEEILVFGKSCVKTEAGFNLDFKESTTFRIFEIEKAVEGSYMQFDNIDVKAVNAEQRLQQWVVGNQTSQSAIDSARYLLTRLQLGLKDATHYLKANFKEIGRKEVQGISRAEIQRHILETTLEKLVKVKADFITAMEILATAVESTASVICSKEVVITDMIHLQNENYVEKSSTQASLQDNLLKNAKEFLLEKSCTGSDKKKYLSERLETQNRQLHRQFQEAYAACTIHDIQLENFKNLFENVSSELQDKKNVTPLPHEIPAKRSKSSLEIRTLLKTTMQASANIVSQRDERLEIADILKVENETFKREATMKGKCNDLELQMYELQIKLLNASTSACEQRLELGILKNMVKEAVKDPRERDAMSTYLLKLLSQRQLQYAEILQCSKKIMRLFSPFLLYLHVCLQQNEELQRNKSTLTAEIYSQSQEIGELKAQLEGSKSSLSKLRSSFVQMKERKDEEIRGFSDELKRLKFQEAVMEADLWDWEQRCQDTEVQLDEKESELEFLRGKLLATQEESKEQVELMYEELYQCQQRMAEMDYERRELIAAMERESATVVEYQEKLETRENEMEEHFARHCFQQGELDSLENEIKDLKTTLKHLNAEVAAKQQRATAAEHMQMDAQHRIEALERELHQKNDFLKCLESELNLLQGSALQELHLKQELDSCRLENDVLQQEMSFQKEKRTRLKKEIGKLTEDIVQFRIQATTWKAKANELETEMDMKRQIIESLEDELRLMDHNLSNTREEANLDLKEVEMKRDQLLMKILELTEQLGMTQMLVEEQNAFISELLQTAEEDEFQSRQKEHEADLLTTSVEELESTVNALESELNFLKKEAEKQRPMREDLEAELRRLKDRISVMESAIEETNSPNAQELEQTLSRLRDTERKVEERESEIMHLQRDLANFETASNGKDAQISDVMTQISDLLHAVETQKNSFQQQPKRVNTTVEESKSGFPEIQSGSHIPNSKVTLEPVSFGETSTQEDSPHSDASHASCHSRIKELEELASTRQKEISVLYSRLAEAESTTHDALRDLHGVKTDLHNVTMQQLTETALQKHEKVEKKKTEVPSLSLKLNGCKIERKSWVEQINTRKYEMEIFRAPAENIVQREQVWADEIEKLRTERVKYQEQIRDLEMEIRRIPSSLLTFHQQINHHAKIKEENQALKVANEKLSNDLHRAEHLHAMEAEDGRVKAEKKLSSLCTSIMLCVCNVTGLSSSENVTSSEAMDALQLLQNRLQTKEHKLSCSKSKVKSTSEWKRVGDPWVKLSPLSSISNFMDQHRRSGPSLALR